MITRLPFRQRTPSLLLICALLCVTLTALSLNTSALALDQSLENGAFHVVISSSGNYQIEALQSGWQFQGSLGAPVSGIQRHRGSDRVGNFQELSFVYQHSGLRQGSFRVYVQKPVLECEMKMIHSGANQGAFPDFQKLPSDIYQLGFQAVPHAIYSFGSLGSEGPWVLFDGKLNSLIISPADHFFVSEMRADSTGVTSGITSSVADLPAGFSHRTIFVAGKGIDTTFTAWGRAMREIGVSVAPSNTADVLLRKLSYWTDHGAAYFYDFDPALGYPGTLFAVKNKFAQLGLPLGAMQLDSWFYPKGKNADWHRTKWTFGVGGTYLYQVDKDLFPNGLETFDRRLDLPLITHARWIDRSSPYRKQYRMSGDVIIDPGYWESTARWLHNANVQVYEQDWLGRYAKTALNLTDPELFHDQMARAMRKYGLTMQYCMALPADFMQGTRYGNLTTIRTSHDRFERKDWDMFLYDSRLASALGIWPWTDVFRSSEEGNLLLATLSAGPVGVGDSLDEINIADLLHSVRLDGVIVKPDVTVRPLDRMYLADARGENSPMVASTWTSFGKSRVAYILAYPRQQTQQQVELRPSELGFRGAVYAYDWRTGHGERITAQDTYRMVFQQGWDYAVIAPIGPSGMALIGDTAQFVTAGKCRIPRFSDDGRMRIRVAFASGETSRTITVYSPRRPKVKSITGKSIGRSYSDGLFTLTLSPAQNNTAQVVLYQ